MRTPATALVLLVLSAPLAAQTEKDFPAAIESSVGAIRRLRDLPSAHRPAPVDLLGQLPRETTAFDQGELNVCHDLAATALVEAALYRQTGDRIALSSADLFIGNTLQRRGAPGDESDSLLSDLDYALTRGVAPAGVVPYPKFRVAYEDLKESLNGAEPEQAAARQKEFIERFYAKQDSWWPGKIGRSRKAVRDAVKDFKLVRWLLPGEKMARFNPHALSPRECDHEGRAQAEFLLEHLNAGRPVAIGFDAAGLPGPARDAKTVAGHSAVVVGVRLENGRPVFALLNAWGDSLRADQLCRIDEMGVVVTPKD